MNSRTCLLVASLLFVGAAPAVAVEHPGVVPKDAECTLCHAAKVRGKSVHSVMATSCDVCHVTQTQGDIDDGKPVNAQAENMLRVPSGVDGVAGACACCQRPVHRLP